MAWKRDNNNGLRLFLTCCVGDPDQDSWSHTCRVVLQGDPEDGRALLRASIHCWTPDSSSVNCSDFTTARFPELSQTANVTSGQLTAFAGYHLYDALTVRMASEESSFCGVHLWQPSTGAGLSGPSDDTTHPSPHSGEPDWGVTFSGVPHLRLIDSVLTDLPLSTVAALLQCEGCERLSIHNLTLQRLRAPWLGEAADAGQQVYGALAASGLRSVAASGVNCTGVTGAHGWACMLLEYKRETSSADMGKDGSFLLEDSKFVGSAVVQGMHGLEGAGGYGFGAVVLATEREGDTDQQRAAGHRRPPGAFGAPSAPPTPGLRPLLSRVELHHVTALNNRGGSGAVLAMVDMDVVRTQARSTGSGPVCLQVL